MEASLPDFVLDVTQVLLSNITQHFAQHPFECVALHGSSLWFAWRRDCRIAVVGNIERGSEAMATLVGSVSIMLSQSSHIVFRPQDTRDDDAMQRDTFYIQAVEIAATYRRKQIGGTRNEVRNAVPHPFVDTEEGVGGHINEFFPAVLCLLSVADRTNAPLPRSHYLHILDVWKAGCIARNTADRMPLHTAFRVMRQVLQFRTTRYVLSTTVGVLEFSRGSTGSSTGCVLSLSTPAVTSGKASLTAPSSRTVPPKRPKNIFFLSLLILLPHKNTQKSGNLKIVYYFCIKITTNDRKAYPY